MEAPAKEWTPVLVLVGVLAACLGYQFGIRPVQTRCDKLGARVESLQEKYDTLHTAQLNFAESKARCDTLAADGAALLAKLPAQSGTAEVTQLADGLLADAGLTATTMSLQGPDAHSVPSLLAGEKTRATGVVQYDFSYRAAGSYAALLRLQDAVSAREDCALSSVSFTLLPDENGVLAADGSCTAELILSVYRAAPAAE